jgi:hypothetical protein
MKKSAIVLCAALLVVSCVSVFAATSHKSSSSKSQGTHVMGEVVSVDAANNTFVVRETLKDKSTKEISISCEPGTKIQMASKTVTLNELAAGDTVTVAYNPTADGKNMAKSVSISKPHMKEGTPSKS